jgi:hypothetical protein
MVAVVAMTVVMPVPVVAVIVSVYDCAHSGSFISGVL